MFTTNPNATLEDIENIRKFLVPIQTAVEENDEELGHFINLLLEYFGCEKLNVIDYTTSFYGRYLCSLINNVIVRDVMSRFAYGFVPVKVNGITIWKIRNTDE